MSRAKAGEVKILELAANYAHGKPGQTVEHTGELTIKVEYDTDD